MIPKSFSIKNGVTHFHYHISDLMYFARQGFLNGNVGVILVRREGNVLVYKGFGTIENPYRKIITLPVTHCEPFDGKMISDEQRLVSPKPLFTDYRMVFLDTSEAI